jgi:hypothetical protein
MAAIFLHAINKWAWSPLNPRHNRIDPRQLLSSLPKPRPAPLSLALQQGHLWVAECIIRLKASRSANELERETMKWLSSSLSGAYPNQAVDEQELWATISVLQTHNERSSFPSESGDSVHSAVSGILNELLGQARTRYPRDWNRSRAFLRQELLSLIPYYHPNGPLPVQQVQNAKKLLQLAHDNEDLDITLQIERLLEGLPEQRSTSPSNSEPCLDTTRVGA